MLRYSSYFFAALILVAICVMLVPTSNATAASDGVQRVYGQDSTPSGAEANAWDNFDIAIWTVIMGLEDGQVIDVVIEGEEHILPTLFAIDFRIEISGPSGGSGGPPPGGGPGVGGGN